MFLTDCGGLVDLAILLLHIDLLIEGLVAGCLIPFLIDQLH